MLDSLTYYLQWLVTRKLVYHGQYIVIVKQLDNCMLLWTLRNLKKAKIKRSSESQLSTRLKETLFYKYIILIIEPPLFLLRNLFPLFCQKCKITSLIRFWYQEAYERLIGIQWGLKRSTTHLQNVSRNIKPTFVSELVQRYNLIKCSYYFNQHDG